ncbi:hypothetical protein, conserved [Leishmania tarentolae]|uniref:Uncharacterized protein n=1 Tax=Leishmania tarentolae TaxID=5689 RepID=A0A640KTD2_LEITA|nr:hypothetical protein, conserved [Leishmania tarentolae]
MVNAVAEELKARGNEAFAAKKFEEAVTLYEKAIEEDSTNYIYYNNRAAAYHELKNYAKAIEDANKSIEIEDNAKAHARLGAALWAQMKYREAKKEFEEAARMDPSKTSIKDSIHALEKLINPMASTSAYANRHGVPHPYEYARAAAAANAAVQTYGGEFVSVETGTIGLVVDMAVIVLSALQLVASMIAPSTASTLWAYILIITMGQQALVMRVSNLLQFKMEILNSWASHFSSLLFTLCFFAQLTGVRPMMFMVVFIAGYGVLDLVHKRQKLAALMGPAYQLIDPYIQQADSAKDAIRIFIATVEALLLFTVMFTGGAFFTLVYIQYAKYRYNHDGYVKLAFKGMRLNITRMATKPFMPQAVNRFAQKFFDLLDNISSNPI